MTSSTKPPQNPRKFHFGLDFDDEEVIRENDLSEKEEELSAEKPEIVEDVPEKYFTEQDIQAAHDEGFRDGFHQGAAEAATSGNMASAEIINQLYRELEILVEGEIQRVRLAQEIALRTAVAGLKKIWPQVVKQLGQEMIETTIRQSMEANPEETRIVVRVHDTMLDPVIDRLPQLQAQQAFAGKVILLADQGVQLGDCKVEWADGGLERLSRTLSAQIDHALEHILTNLSQHIQKAEPEGISL